MWLLLGPKGTVKKYGRYTANGGHPKELHKDVSNNILTGITEIAGANHGACAINGVGKLYCALVDTATFYRIPRTPDPIPDGSWHAFVDECLTEVPVTGECTNWASDNNYGTIPNCDTSLVTVMSGTFEGYSQFDGDISKWNTSSVATMASMFEGSLLILQYQSHVFSLSLCYLSSESPLRYEGFRPHLPTALRCRSICARDR